MIPGPSIGNPLLSYALFHCDPFREPPFDLELGFNDKSVKHLKDCASIPDAIEKLKDFCKNEHVTSSSEFILLYPIYLEAMDTDAEQTMHNVAWLIKDEADKNSWNFGRIEGYTGKSLDNY